MLGTTLLSRAEPPPVSAFARTPQLSEVSLSPSGQYLLYVTKSGDRPTVFSKDMRANGRAIPVLGLQAKKGEAVSFSWCRWGNETRIVCGARVIREASADVTQLMAVNANGSDRHPSLFQFTEDARERYEDQIVNLLPDDPRSILIQSSSRRVRATLERRTNREADPAVFLLDLYSGRVREVVSPSNPRVDYFSDESGNVVLSRGFGNNRFSFWARAIGENSWRQLFDYAQFEKPPRPLPFAVAPNSNHAYAIGAGTHRSALFELDLSNSGEDRLVFEAHDADVRRALMSRSGRVLGVELDSDPPRAHYLNERDAAVIAGADRVLQASYNEVADVTPDGSFYLVRSRSDVDAGSYFLLDSTSRDSSSVFVGRDYPELDPATLPRMERVAIAGKGGDNIAYLSKPLSGKKPYPLVVMPDDGPYGRAEWRFSFLRHFLLSRGYAVLQIRIDETAGGLRPLDKKPDWHSSAYATFLDGMHWGVRQDFIDGTRTAVIGWGLGGYLALLVSQRDPDLIACAITVNAITDLRELKRTGSSDLRRLELQEMLGIVPSGRDSVRKSASKTGTRVLIIYGTHDTMYSLRHSEQMAAHLSFHDIPHDVKQIPLGTHDLTHPTARAELLSTVETFLAAHLMQRPPDVLSDANR